MAQLPDPFELIHHQIAELLATGHTVKATAEESGVSEATLYRWKRELRFRDLIESYKPETQFQQALNERSENFDLLMEARNTEWLLTTELRDALERVIGIVVKRLDSMEDSEVEEMAIRHISPLLKVVGDGLSIVQASHDRLTGYSALLKQLEEIIEKNR